MHREAKRGNRGFTLLEILLVVMIIVILAAVAFIAVARYQRSAAILERDGIAKEIFIAAQNHLTLADSQGFLPQKAQKGASDIAVTAFYNTAGYTDTELARMDVRYFVVPSPDSVVSTDSVLGLMLPQMSVDETVRLGGSYIVIYDYNSATVLDVFYTEPGGRFSHSFSGSDSVSDLLGSFAGDDSDKKSARKDNEYILGWYGGAGARLKADEDNKLLINDFRICNEDTLRVEITNPNPGTLYASLRLTVRGADSGAVKTYELVTGNGTSLTYLSGTDAKGVEYSADHSSITVTLDDITSPDLHFNQLFPGFKPGEDLALTLEAYSSAELVVMPMPVGPKTVNSLFAAVDGSTAEVTSFRHLENLDPRVSGIDADASNRLSTPLTGAKQTENLSWPDFFAAANGRPAGAEILAADGTSLSAGDGLYFPVDLPDGFDYDGQNCSISQVKINFGENAGLFGTLAGGTIQNLELDDFTVAAASTGANAGALAGKISDTTVRNVLARCTTPANYDSATEYFVSSASGSAGGLIGLVNGTQSHVVNCATAIPVSAGGDAGGLVGTVAGTGAQITGCYSGGRTDKGEYYNHNDSGARTSPIYNVTGAANVGGLVGDAGSAAISKSYSTCSASGATVGGLAGKAGGKLEVCYAAGCVSGTTAGALVGNYTNSDPNKVSECRYYRIVNETVTPAADGNPLKATRLVLGPFGSAADVSYGVAALDASAGDYNTFVQAPANWDPVEAFDDIPPYYQGKYPLRSVSRLGASVEDGDFVATHYGDWPRPEQYAVNVKA